MTSHDKDDVLSLDGEEDSGEFSGFSPLKSPQPATSKGKKKILADKTVKSKVVRITKKRNNKENEPGESDALPINVKDSPVLDLTKLSENDISKLREVLGINSHQPAYANEEDITSVFGDSLDNMPQLHIEFNPADLSDGETPQRRLNKNGNIRQISNELSDALFDNEEGEIIGDDEWELPRLKAPEKGQSVSTTLAKKVNVACTSQCETDSLIVKYKVPQNCDKACPPLVNGEVWKVLDKRAQTQDKGLQDIQNLVATGLTPIIKLAEVLKPQIMTNNEAKTLLSDSLTLLGQVQYNLSIRHRYFIRPNLKKKYHSLCSITTPITDKLFGDDISKDIKNCDSLSSLGKDQSYRPYRGRGGRFPRRGYNNYGYGYQQQSGYASNYGYGYGANMRYHPYSQRGQYKQPTRGRGAKKTVTATATAPNDQN
ncbi:MAG: hypothetical protein N0C90_24410 [Candidatus Thiodiazotropha endolucinida]|nr:hypothetical protein [Candidatus Thiodiazotropha taylori]MCW4264494.1 hypothetical protein [Candidatus Thiodiazotropha endolucinida]